MSAGIEYKVLEVHDKPTLQISRPFLSDVSCMKFINSICVYGFFKDFLFIFCWPCIPV